MLLEPPHPHQYTILWKMLGYFSSLPNCLDLHWPSTCCILLLSLECRLLQAVCAMCLSVCSLVHFDLVLSLFLKNTSEFCTCSHKNNVYIQFLPAPLRERTCSTTQYIWLLSLMSWEHSVVTYCLRSSTAPWSSGGGGSWCTREWPQIASTGRYSTRNTLFPTQEDPCWKCCAIGIVSSCPSIFTEACTTMQP